MSVDKFEYLKGTRGIPAAPRIVLHEILNYSDAQGENAYPSVERLMADCGMSRSTVCRHLKWLRDNGWIVLRSRGGRSGDGHTWSSTYSLAYGTVPQRLADEAETYPDTSIPDHIESQPAAESGGTTVPVTRYAMVHDTKDEYRPDQCTECYWQRKACGVTVPRELSSVGTGYHSPSSF